MIPSPITGLDSKKIDSFEVEKIIESYKSIYKIDVSPYFGNQHELALYECSSTGLKFFHPSSLAGDEVFYQALEDLPFYYADWKWDYEKGITLIENGSNVLDIGCGRGAFLEKLKTEKNCTVTGLEFNPSAIEVLKQKNINAFQKTIESFALNNPNSFDVVCFFQVLEHIVDVKSFLTAAIEVLKPNGKMIIAVPYNKPYMYGNNKYETLNLPPHHMGWWDENSLQKIEQHFNLKYINHFIKPFRDFNSYLNSLEHNASINSPIKKKWLQFIRPLNKLYIQIIKNKIPGGYIIAEYIKNKT